MRELAEAGSFIWNLCRKYGGEKEMSVTVLKRSALGAMVVNYIGVFIPGAPVWLQWLGRLSAPLFFYCMAWSIDRTGNKKAYFLRLYLAGVAMGLLNLIMSFVAQGAGLGAAVSSNIFATLFASAFFIEVIEYGRKHPKHRMRLFLSYGLFQVAVAGLWAALYELVGVPYAVLNFFHMPGLKWIESSDTALLAVIIVTVWKSLGYAMIFYLSALEKVPSELYEACGLDGARKWQRFRDITIPSISPTTFFLMIITMVNSLQAYDQIQILTQGGPSGSTRTLLYMYYQLGFEEFDMGQATAVAMVMIVITVLLSAVQFRASKKWVHY